jgi:hypothetical protein
MDIMREHRLVKIVMIYEKQKSWNEKGSKQEAILPKNTAETMIQRTYWRRTEFEAAWRAPILWERERIQEHQDCSQHYSKKGDQYSIYSTVEIITSRNLQLEILDSKNFSFCPYIIFSSDHLENTRRQQRQMQFFICNRQSYWQISHQLQ